MSKKAKAEVADNSADTVMDGVLSENQAKLNKLNSSIQAAYERRRKIITEASSTPTISSRSFTVVLRGRHFSML